MAPQPPPWIFKCYHRASRNGDKDTDVIREWYDGLDEEVKADLDAGIEILEKRPNNEWLRPRFAPLKSKACKGICEIRADGASGEYRVLGCYGIERNEFTLYVGFKKEHKSDYERACKAAQTRKREVEDDPTRAKRCQFP
jgi:hypothetical protein